MIGKPEFIVYEYNSQCVFVLLFSVIPAIFPTKRFTSTKTYGNNLRFSSHIIEDKMSEKLQCVWKLVEDRTGTGEITKEQIKYYS